MRKSIVLSLVLILSLVFVSCNGDPKPTPQPGWDNSQAYKFEWKDEELQLKSDYITTDSYGTLIIPETVDGKTVTNVNINGSAGYVDLLKVPSTVESLVLEFYMITNMNVPKSVTDFEVSGKLMNASFEEGGKYYLDEDAVFFKENDDLVLEKVLASTAGVFTVADDVKSIEDHAFSGCSKLTKIVIPDGVQMNVVDHAFQLLDALTSITLPNTVTSIGIEAFAFCNNLETVGLPDSLTSIGSQAFIGCDSLKEIVIPKKVTTIGNKAFGECVALEKVTFEEGSACTTLPYAVFMGCLNLETVILPNTVDAILSSAFANCTALKTIKHSEAETTSSLPTGLEFLGSSAFYDCKSLVLDEALPASLKEIGTMAFRGCASLTSLNFSHVTKMVVSNYTFYGCSKLASIVLPTAPTVPIMAIGSAAFQGCSALTSITLPDTVTSIGSMAFYGCSSLTGINIPASVTEIGGLAFYGCTGLTGTFTIPNTVTSIGSGLFQNCTELTGVTLSNKIITIASSTFNGCKKLTTINWNSAGVTQISNSAFRGCDALTSITIPATVKSIGLYAFAECEKLSSVSFAGTYTAESHLLIGEGAFSYCPELTTLEFPQYAELAVTSDTFKGCAKLETLKLPSVLKNLDGTKVVKIGDSAFEGFTALKYIQFYDDGTNTLKTIGKNAFKDSGLVGKDSTNDLKLPSSVETIESGAFANCTGLVTLKLFETNISEFKAPKSGEYGVFEGCSNLQTLELPYGTNSDIIRIDEDTFKGCTALVSVKLSGKVRTIWNSAFQGKTNLTTVYLPAELTSISADAFNGCTSLHEMTFYGTKAEWGNVYKGNNAFKDCPTVTVHCSNGDEYINPTT